MLNGFLNIVNVCTQVQGDETSDDDDAEEEEEPSPKQVKKKKAGFAADSVDDVVEVGARAGGVHGGLPVRVRVRANELLEEAAWLSRGQPQRVNRSRTH